MSRENVRSPPASLHLEFHHTGDEVNQKTRNIVAELEQRGIRALDS